MTLDQIHCFLTVAEQKSLSRAAAQMYISPSTMSYQIKCFEEELGFPLIERTASGVTLTDTGRYLEEQFKQAVSMLDNAVENARSLHRNSIRFTIALGCSYPYSEIGLAMDRLLDRYPYAQIRLQPMVVEDPLLPLVSGQADVLLTYKEYTQNLNNCVFFPLKTSGLYLITRRTPQNSSLTEITLKDIYGMPLFFPKSLKKYSTFQRVHDDYLALGPEARILKSPNCPIQEVFALIEQGKGSVLSHKNNADIALNNPSLTAIPLNGYDHTIGICWLKQREQEITLCFAHDFKNHLPERE